MLKKLSKKLDHEDFKKYFKYQKGEIILGIHLSPNEKFIFNLSIQKPGFTYEKDVEHRIDSTRSFQVTKNRLNKKLAEAYKAGHINELIAIEGESKKWGGYYLSLLNFDFYHNLTTQQKKHYDLMLETHYVLLRCDECWFKEIDEHNQQSTSTSWLYSLAPTLRLFGYPPDSYPQGSFSANRFYYEAIRNYQQENFFKPQFNQLRATIKNFIRLRCDDTRDNPTYQFESQFRIVKESTREQRLYRLINPNIRHTASAIWILCEEQKYNSENKLNSTDKLYKSIKGFLEIAENYLEKQLDKEIESYIHMTLSSIKQTCESITHVTTEHIQKKAEELQKKCIEKLISDQILEPTVTGTYRWKLPDPTKQQMANYEYFLNAFVITQIPEIINNPKIQTIIKDAINNTVEKDGKSGIPIHPIERFQNPKQAKPDFGATAETLVFLWQSITYGLGNNKWQEYCKEKFPQLLTQCLNLYNSEKNYLIPLPENHAKILLMPRFNKNQNRERRIHKYIEDIKQIINQKPKKEWENALNKISHPEGLEHVKIIIMTWEIPTLMTKQEN